MNEVHTFPATQNVQEMYQPGETLHPSSDLVEYLRQYARQRPAVVALWCLGMGLVLGWKLKPW